MQNKDISRVGFVEFPPFRVDLENGQVWRGKKAIPLRPKAFAILHHLLEHAGRTISRDELDQVA